MEERTSGYGNADVEIVREGRRGQEDEGGRSCREDLPGRTTRRTAGRSSFGTNQGSTTTSVQESSTVAQDRKHRFLPHEVVRMSRRKALTVCHLQMSLSEGYPALVIRLSISSSGVMWKGSRLTMHSLRTTANMSYAFLLFILVIPPRTPLVLSTTQNSEEADL
jgi:hypothetical protein